MEKEEESKVSLFDSEPKKIEAINSNDMRISNCRPFLNEMKTYGYYIKVFTSGSDNDNQLTRLKSSSPLTLSRKEFPISIRDEHANFGSCSVLVLGVQNIFSFLISIM